MALSVSGIVRVSVNLNPLAAAVRAFGTLMIAGDSDIINGEERYREFLSYEGVLAAGFSADDPEALAAASYYSQVPQPATLMIGRWLRTATGAMNLGGILSASEQLMSNWTVISNGGLVIVIGGVTKTLTGLDFSLCANLNAVAAIIDAALSGGSCTWNGSYFQIVSDATGASSSVGYATTGAGTNLSPLLKLTSGTSQGLIAGFDAETPVQCATALALASPNWYGLMFSASTQPSDSQNLAVSAFIEALSVVRIFGVTITNTNVLSANVEDDLASLMKDAGYKRSFCQYSSDNYYVVASFFGRGFTVDFTAQNTTITLMFKQEPGVVAEELDENQAAVLADKRCNVFVEYDNDTAILQHGVMSGDAFFDEIHGTDWLQNAIQTAAYNVLYLTGKVPQTDAGVNQIVNAVAGVCGQAVLNGLVAPGVWSGPSFGDLKNGDFLNTGFYIYAQPVALQSQADRDARIAPPIQVAIKLAGAIQSVDILVDVNR